MTKTLRRVISVVAALAVVMLMAVPFGVAPTAPEKAWGANDGSITIENTVAGETYKVYKVFDATTNNSEADNNTDGKNISYTYTKKSGDTDAFLTALQDEDSPFTLTQVNNSDVYNVSLKSEKGATDAVTFLNQQVSNLGTPVNGTEGTTATERQNPSAGQSSGADITVSNLAYGYYYITTTTGSAVSVNSAAKNVKVEDKNTVPTIDKKQSKTNSNYSDNDLDLNIGDTVYFQITVTAGKTNDKDIYVTDTLSNGLSLNYSGSGTNIKLNGWSIKEYTNGTGEGTSLRDDSFTISEVTLQGFKVHLKADFVKTLSGPSDGAGADTVVITYSAHLNENAVTGADGNTNTAKLEYSKQTSEDSTKVLTYDFDVVKTDATETTANVLTGAKFKLYKGTPGDNDSVQRDGDAIKFVKTDPTGSDTYTTYRVATQAETVEGSSTQTTDEIDAGYVRIVGLKNGTYALEETQAPSGYQQLTSLKKIVVNGANNRATVTGAVGSQTYTTTNNGGVQVVNSSGSSLPTTGGPGTTALYVIGAILVLAAGVGLVARRRMRQH